MQLSIIAIVFSVIFLCELPDKSFFSTLVMSRQWHRGFVWLGAASAFLLHVILAVSVGRVLEVVPHRLLALITTCLFLLGATLLLFGKHSLDPDSAAQPTGRRTKRPLGIFWLAFGVTFLGEWGDITQIMTANYAAHYHSPLYVGIGAVLALWSVSGLAVVFGSKAVSLISPRLVQMSMVIIFLGFALFSLKTALGL